jgi:hypothetical protein
LVFCDHCGFWPGCLCPAPIPAVFTNFRCSGLPTIRCSIYPALRELDTKRVLGHPYYPKGHLLAACFAREIIYAICFLGVLWRSRENKTVTSPRWGTYFNRQQKARPDRRVLCYARQMRLEFQMRKIMGLALAMFICGQVLSCNPSSSLVTASAMVSTDVAPYPQSDIHQSGTTNPQHTIWLPLVFRPPLGNTYYVSTTGNDINQGNLMRPFRTIQKGVKKLAAGDTLYIREGIYTEKIDIRVSGSPSLPITISSYQGESVVINGDSLEPGFNCDGLIGLYGSYIIIENLEVTNPSGCGIIRPRSVHITFFAT